LVNPNSKTRVVEGWIEPTLPIIEPAVDKKKHLTRKFHHFATNALPMWAKVRLRKPLPLSQRFRQNWLAALRTTAYLGQH
jgi:hypothetical protein